MAQLRVSLAYMWRFLQPVANLYDGSATCMPHSQIYTWKRLCIQTPKHGRRDEEGVTRRSFLAQWPGLRCNTRSSGLPACVRWPGESNGLRADAIRGRKGSLSHLSVARWFERLGQKM